jgi:hypothetical protein
MDDLLDPRKPHPAGEAEDEALNYPAPHRVETPGGPVHWEEDPGITPHGGLTYFLEFLRISGRARGDGEGTRGSGWAKNGDAKEAAAAGGGKPNNAEWYARGDSNARPFAPEANALSS